MCSIMLLLVCLFSICLKAQTEFRVYQKESKKSWYYIEVRQSMARNLMIF